VCVRRRQPPVEHVPVRKRATLMPHFQAGSSPPARRILRRGGGAVRKI
jgi:hypothetical protein